MAGIDISLEACEHAHRKYGVDARIGSAEAIPLPDRSIDMVVSFETIEHVDCPADFLRECARVLVPEGMLIISTPNRPVYSGDGRQNPFHRVEFDEDGVRRSSSHASSDPIRLYTQVPHSAAWWSPRSMAAERSPWLRIKGFWRLSSWLCPAIQESVDPVSRSAADDVVLGHDTFPSSLFNPYIVRTRSPSSHERPYILVAVAEGVKSA